MALVRFQREGEAGLIILARSEAGNAVSPALIEDFATAVGDAEASSSRAILITAEGGNFCVGADIKHLAAPGADLADNLRHMANGFHAAQARLHALPVPIVAAVRGHAIGGGFGLALTADFIICADDASFATGYARLGLSADAGVSLFLTQAVGTRRANALLIDPRTIPAAEALSLGIVHEIVAGDQLEDRALGFARDLAAGPTAAFAAIKRLTNAAAMAPALREHLDLEAKELVALAARDDVAGAIRARSSRGKPVFSR